MAGMISPASTAAASLAGIARMAAASPKLRQRSDVEYFALQSRSVLNRESSGRMPFAWTINPYRGCEFGCTYCYARYTHEFMEMWDGREFERKIYAKVNAPELLRVELRAAKDKGLPIAIGTATDPYQPAEKQFGITRQLLEVLAEFEALDFSLSTKSVLLLRDLGLLRLIARRHCFSVHMTVTTTNERLARLLEPKAPPPTKRLEAVSVLVAAGIRVGVMAMPILPALNDSPDALEALARAAARAGAQSLYGHPLFLTLSTLRQFMPWLEREFPHLVKRYRRLYARSAYLNGEYREQIVKVVAALRAHYCLDDHREGIALAARYPQMALPFEGAPEVQQPLALRSPCDAGSYAW